MQTVGELSRADRYLIKWCANAKVGDALPLAYRDSGTQRLIERLIDTGVVTSPYTGQLIDAAAIAAREDCAKYVAAHPGEFVDVND